MEYIRIYDRNETEFSGNGRAVLDKASNIHITREINGDYSFNFTYPIHDIKMKHIQTESICKYQGQLYRIRIIDHGDVSAKAIYYDAARTHLQYVEDMIGQTPYNIMVRLFKNTPVHVMSQGEIKKLGMDWVTDKTDFFEVSKTTPIGALAILTEQLEKQKAVCELYIDNFNIALVKRIGADNAGRITLRFNAEETESQLSSVSTITRLYAYGMDDLDLSTVNDGKQYIDSPYINTLGRIEGHMEFDDCEDPAELLKLAQWQFSKDNINRIDVPKYNMTVKYTDAAAIYKKRCLRPLALGDRIKIYDDMMNFETLQRIIKTDIYPHEPSKSTIEVGQPMVTVESFLGKINSSATNYRLSTNIRHEMKTSKLEMMRCNKRVSINQALRNQRISSYNTGALFESPDGSCAVAVINGTLAVAKGKTDGEWDWTTVIDDNQVLVSEVFTGALYTNMCSVLSDNGKLIIKDSLIIMKDNSDVVRFESGYKDGEYVFCLYDANGEKTVYINNDGKAVYAGTIQTMKDCIIQGELRVGLGGNNTKGLAFYGDSYQPDAEGNYSAPYARMLPWVDKYDDKIKGINVEDGKLCVNSVPVATENRVKQLINEAIEKHIKIYHNNS